MRHFEEFKEPLELSVRQNGARHPRRPVWPASSEIWTEPLAGTFEQRILLERFAGPAQTNLFMIVST